mgnify:CR=1 FL=1
MKLSILKGATSVIIRVFIADSSSTVGAGLTGLVYNSASLVCYRARDDDGNAAGTAISLATMTRGTWASGGFVEKDATNMPGWYEFGVPNSALASGSRSVSFTLKGATNMVQTPVEIELTGVDNQDATAFGVSRIDATISSRGTSTLTQTQVTGGAYDVTNASCFVNADVKKLLGTAWLTPATAGTPDVNVKLIKGQTVTCAASVTIYPAVGMTATANGNFEIVFNTDFATNYDTTADKWSVTGGSGATAADVWAYSTRELTSGANIVLPSNGLSSVSAWTVNITGNLSGSVGSVSGNVGGGVAGSVGSVTGNVGGSVSGSVGSIAGTITSLDALDSALTSAHGSGGWTTATGFSTHSAIDVWGVTTREITGGTIGTYTGNTPQTGDAFAYLGANLGLLGANLAISADLYTAQIEFAKDTANSRDEYNVTWLKNGIPQTSGITTPLIQVVKRDATDLVASTAMTDSGSGVLIYNEATNRTTAGESYKVIATATIDSSARTFTKWIGRDV